MLSSEEIIGAMRREVRPLLEAAMEGVLTKARKVLEKAEKQRAEGLTEVAEERAQGFADVAKERAAALAEVDARRAELHREIKAMQMHQDKQQGHVELNIGGYRFETSVQTLRRLPHTFFDAYFSGRYAQDVCNDGSIFVDRDGEHFGHVLEYMRDGVVSVAEPGAQPSVSLLRALKREFGFYSIELSTGLETTPNQPEVAYAIGGRGQSSMERYDTLSGQWSAAAAMDTARAHFGACVVAGNVYVTGGLNESSAYLRSVEMYVPSTDTWSAVAPLPAVRCAHSAVAVGSAMYVLGGFVSGRLTASVLKFDNTSGAWSECTPMPASRRRFAACAVGADIYVFGWFLDGLQATVFKFDTEIDEWSTLAPMPSPHTFLTANVLGGLVYIVGRTSSRRSVLRMDPVSGVWETLAPTLADRLALSTFVLDGSLYAAGGSGQTGQTSKSVERYDVASNTWTAVAGMLEDRVSFCAVAIGSVDTAEEQDLFDSLIAKAARRHL
jgi:hypothetical protein